MNKEEAEKLKKGYHIIKAINEDDLIKKMNFLKRYFDKSKLNLHWFGGITFSRVYTTYCFTTIEIY